MLVVIDNYDSFTYNLVHYLDALGATPRVFRNDEISVEKLAEFAPDRLLISPGPGDPSAAGISCDAIREFAGRVPVLGVCLGFQCIAEAFGAVVERSAVPVHGKTSLVEHDESILFHGLPNPFAAMRYHSLTVPAQSLRACLVSTAWTADGVVMGLQHTRYTVMGVQFHPESVLTPAGMNLLENFLGIDGGEWR